MDRDYKCTYAAKDPDTQIEIQGTRRCVTGLEFRSAEYPFAREIIENGLKAERQGFDAFAIGSSYDAGLNQSRELPNMPVVGMTESTMLLAGLTGRISSPIMPVDHLFSYP